MVSIKMKVMSKMHLEGDFSPNLTVYAGNNYIRDTKFADHPEQNAWTNRKKNRSHFMPIWILLRSAY